MHMHRSSDDLVLPGVKYDVHLVNFTVTKDDGFAARARLFVQVPELHATWQQCAQIDVVDMRTYRAQFECPVGLRSVDVCVKVVAAGSNEETFDTPRQRTLQWGKKPEAAEKLLSSVIKRLSAKRNKDKDKDDDHHQQQQQGKDAAEDSGQILNVKWTWGAPGTQLVVTSTEKRVRAMENAHAVLAFMYSPQDFASLTGSMDDASFSPSLSSPRSGAGRGRGMAAPPPGTSSPMTLRKPIDAVAGSGRGHRRTATSGRGTSTPESSSPDDGSGLRRASGAASPRDIETLRRPSGGSSPRLDVISSPRVGGKNILLEALLKFDELRNTFPSDKHYIVIPGCLGSEETLEKARSALFDLAKERQIFGLNNDVVLLERNSAREFNALFNIRMMLVAKGVHKAVLFARKSHLSRLAALWTRIISTGIRVELKAAPALDDIVFTGEEAQKQAKLLELKTKQSEEDMAK